MIRSLLGTQLVHSKLSDLCYSYLAMHTSTYSPLNKTLQNSNSSQDLRISPNNPKQISNPVPPRKGSPVGAVFIIVNAALGAGLLSFPQAFVFAGGVVAGLVLETCLAVLMAVNLVVVAYATDISGASSYQQMISKLFGSTTAVIVKVCSIQYTLVSTVFSSLQSLSNT